MNPFLARLAPVHLVRLGRLAAAVSAVLLLAGYPGGAATPASTAVLAFVLGLGVLLGFPDQRSSELAGVLAIGITLAEFLVAAQTGHLALWRWAVTLAALAVLLLPLKVQHLRGLGRRNRYRRLGELDTGRSRSVPAASSAARAIVTRSPGHGGAAFD